MATFPKFNLRDIFLSCLSTLLHAVLSNLSGQLYREIFLNFEIAVHKSNFKTTWVRILWLQWHTYVWSVQTYINVVWHINVDRHTCTCTWYNSYGWKSNTHTIPQRWKLSSSVNLGQRGTVLKDLINKDILSTGI